MGLQTGQNALIQKSVFEDAIQLLGETIDDMDKKFELKDNRIDFLADEVGILNEQIRKHVEQVNLKESPNKETEW